MVFYFRVVRKGFWRRLVTDVGTFDRFFSLHSSSIEVQSSKLCLKVLIYVTFDQQGPLLTHSVPVFSYSMGKKIVWRNSERRHRVRV